jgi:transcriptional regulator with XRE-family HTH domain
MSETTLADRIRLALKECGMTQQALSTASGIPYRSVQHYTAGTQMPGSEALIKIRTATGASIDWLLTGEGEQLYNASKAQPRPLELSDLEYLRARFSNFDAVFTVRWPGYKSMSESDFIAIVRETLKLQQEKDGWHAGIDVDRLSDDEVAVLAATGPKERLSSGDDS